MKVEIMDLSNPDSGFPVFVLCGVLISEKCYESVKNKFNQIKEKFWQNKEVIFHSRDIRKCEKEFSVLLDLDKKRVFYEQLNEAVRACEYTIVASGINKNEFIKQYGKLMRDVYEWSLSFIIERLCFS